MIPEKAIEKIVESIENLARGDLSDRLDSYLKAKDKLEESFEERKLIEVVLAQSLGQDYCGNGATRTQRQEAAKEALRLIREAMVTA